MKRTDYCLHIKGHSGEGIEREKYILIGELVDINARYFLRDCQNTDVKRALTNELFSLYGYLEHIELYPVDILPENQRYNLNIFIDKNLQQSIEILRTKYNAFVQFNERDDIPEQALLIGDEVIPIMPPVPDECIKVFLRTFDSARIQKNNDREYYSSNERCSIVLYDNLSIEQQFAYNEYGSYFFFQQNNLGYLDEVLESIEDWAQKDFERKLKTSTCQSTASALIAGDSPVIPPAVANVPAVIPDVIPDYSSFVPSVASRKDCVTSKMVEVKQPEDEHLKVLKQIDKRLENIENGVQQTANNTESIDRKFPGKITRVKDIPPYNPTDKRWVKATRYSEITGVERASLDSERFRVKEENIAPDKNSGIHGEHCWRRVNGTIFYFVYQPKYLDWL